MPELNNENKIEDIIPEIKAENTIEQPNSTQRFGKGDGKYKDYEIEELRAGRDAVLLNRLGIRIATGLGIFLEKVLFKSFLGDELLKIESKEETGSSVAGKATLSVPLRLPNIAAASAEAGDFDEEGMVYFDITSSEPRIYKGGTWANL